MITSDTAAKVAAKVANAPAILSGPEKPWQPSSATKASIRAKVIESRPLLFPTLSLLSGATGLYTDSADPVSDDAFNDFFNDDLLVG